MEYIKTFKDIQDGIISRAKLEDKTSVRDTLKEFINTAYSEIIFEEPYRWNGDTMPLVLKGKYTTGTIDVTEGSDIISGNSTVWTEFDHLWSKIHISGSNVTYKIIRVDEAGQYITLDAPWIDDTATTVGYTIYKDEYGLFPNLQDIRKLRIQGLVLSRQPIPCGPNEIDTYRDSSPFTEGLPKNYTIFGKNIYTSKTWATFNIDTDFWEDDFFNTPSNNNLIVWPGILSEDKVSIIRYTKVFSPLSADDEEPIIPLENRPILMYRVLKEHFLKGRDAALSREWERMYSSYITKMSADVETTDDELILSVDRRNFSRTNYSAIWDDE